MPGFLNDSDLQTYVAAALKKTVSDLATLPNGNPSYWPTIITQANLSAWNEIQDRLIRRGWTLTQVNAWDRGVEVQKAIGLYFALRDGGALNGFDDRFIAALKRYFDESDPTNVLDRTLVTNGSVWQKPGDSPGTVGTGPLNTGQDLFVMDPNDDRIGNVTRF